MAANPPRLPFHAATAQRNQPAPLCGVGEVLRQPDLFDPERAAEWDRLVGPAPLARATDPDTSHAAAAKAEGFAVNHRNRIRAALDTPGTCKDIAQRLGDLDHVAVARRLPELQAMGLAEPTAERRDGCRVWARKAPR